MKHFKNLKEHRKNEKSFSDLLNWAIEVDDGIIMNKDGSLMRGYLYQGQDLALMSVTERNYTVSILNKALTKLGTGWTLHQDAIRLQCVDYPNKERNHFKGFASKIIEAERRKQFGKENSYFESLYGIVLTYMPVSIAEGKIRDLLFDTNDKSNNKNVNYLENAIKQFKSNLMEFEDIVSNVLDLSPLNLVSFHNEKTNEMQYFDLFLQYLNYTLIGKMHSIRLPNFPMYIDSILGSEFQSGIIPILDDKYIQTISIDGFPSESYPNILNELDQLPFEYRWNTRFIFQDKIESENMLEAFRKDWEAKSRGFLGQFSPSLRKNDEHSLLMAEEARGALIDLKAGHIGYGYYSSTIIIRDDSLDKLELKSREVRKLLNALGFNSRIETVNNMDAFIGTLPGHVIENVRRPVIHTLHLANFLPLANIWVGEDTAPCDFYEKNSPPLLYAATTGSTPFRFNLHIGDLGHTLMFGPTGAGKSTALAFIASQFLRYKNAKVFAFDKGNSLEALTYGVGGNHFNILSDTSEKLFFSPLSNIDKPSELSWASGWIEDLLALNKIELSSVQRNEILKALKRLSTADEKTITNLKVEIQDADLKNALEAYTIEGELGDLLDTTTDVLKNSFFTVFELEELMNRQDRVKIAVLLYLFHWIENQLDGSPSLLILDEAWIMLGNPVFKEKIKEWLKVLRKKNCAVLLATQSLSDATESGILNALIESTATKIFLANKEAESEINKEVYKSIGCTDREIEVIKNMIPKREYLIKGAGRRVINFDLDKVALAFVGVSDPKSLKTIRDLRKKFGKNWVIQYLLECGIDYKDYVES